MFYLSQNQSNQTNIFQDLPEFSGILGLSRVIDFSSSLVPPIYCGMFQWLVDCLDGLLFILLVWFNVCLFDWMVFWLFGLVFF